MRVGEITSNNIQRNVSKARKDIITENKSRLKKEKLKS